MLSTLRTRRSPLLLSKRLQENKAFDVVWLEDHRTFDTEE